MVRSHQRPLRMSPLRIEAFHPVSKTWVSAGRELSPNDQPGTVSNNLADGRREIYVFYCSSDDRESYIKKIINGLDMSFVDIRIISQEVLENAELITILTKGAKPLEISVKTDVSLQSRKIRLTHI